MPLSAACSMAWLTPSGWRLALHSGWRGNTGLKALSTGEVLAPDVIEGLVPKTKALWVRIPWLARAH